MSILDKLDSYSVKNFISFMDEVYFRLFVRQFEACWPAHVYLLALGVVILVFACLGKPRVVAAGLAIPMATCAVTFHFELYAELTPVGKFFGWAFLIQILLLLIWGFVTKPHKSSLLSVHALAGGAIVLFALIGYPFLTQLGDRTWKGAEYLGMAPDPTIAFVFGVLLICARPVWFFLLLPIPLLWTTATYGTLDVLEASFIITLPIIATITIVAGVWKAIFYRPNPLVDDRMHMSGEASPGE